MRAENHKNTCTSTINTTLNCPLRLFFSQSLEINIQLREKGGWDMLIFQPHPPHIITNSWRPLHDLSHSTIILWKARSPYQHVILKTWPPKLLIQIPLSTLVDNRTSEKHLHWTSQQPSECPPQLIQTLLL